MTGTNMIGLLAISHAISACHSESGWVEHVWLIIPHGSLQIRPLPNQ